MANFKQFENNFFIGPQPTEQDLTDAKQRGIHTVIDLRMPSETATPNADLVKKSGLSYVNIPVNKEALLPRQVDELAVVLQHSQGPFLLHCATGARAALLLALSRAKQNSWLAERTFQEAEAMGYNLQGSPGFAAFVHQETNK